MQLKERIPELLSYINSHEKYLAYNAELLDIHSGNLKPYVEKSLQQCLSPEYYNKIKERIIIINVLKRFIDKVSKVYALTPVRTVEEGSARDAQLLEEYEELFDMNVRMNDADEYSNLFKGYALKPFIDGHGDQALRVLPYDRFIVKSDTPEDPLSVDVYIEMMGERNVMVKDKRVRSGIRSEKREVFYIYTDKEFIAIDDRGDEYAPAMAKIENYENPQGFIPSYYGSRSSLNLVPKQDTDILNITKVIPVLLSDLSGTILFQCFSIMYGVDVDSENLVMSPNGFWSFKSDTNKKPEIGVIKPSADIDKVLNYIMQVFTFWLETKGVKVGSVGSMDGDNAASGIAKIIDEMDTTEIKKLSIKAFKRDEERFWQLVKKTHNYWVDTGKVINKPKFTDKFKVSVDFDEPTVVIDREKEVRTISMEVQAGFLYPEKAITKLYPDASEEELAKHLAYFNNEDDNGEVATDENRDPERVQSEREEGDSSRDN